jgi:hypothetical protein
LALSTSAIADAATARFAIDHLAARRAIKSLVDAGYLVRIKTRSGRSALALRRYTLEETISWALDGIKALDAKKAVKKKQG